MMRKTNNKEFEKAIVGIIHDHIIWSRVSNKMRAINNVVNPKKPEENFEPDLSYRGFENAFLIMGIHKEHKLTAILGEMIWQILDYETDAQLLAHKIYIELTVTSKNYFLDSNQV